VALPFVQADFGVVRADASLPYTLTMIGFGLGSIVAGWLADRFGTLVPVVAGACLLGLGLMASSQAGNLTLFSVLHGLFIGAGSSATFSPLVSDISLWFTRRRGIAVAICASGNYLAGTIWPLVLAPMMTTQGWRATYFTAGLFCLVAMLPLAIMLRRRAPIQLMGHTAASAGAATRRDLSPATLQVLICLAGMACCVAMAMPQVHIVAYCGDLGYGVARGSEMLALMLGCGIISRLVSGVVADRIGGLATLLLGSALQGVALFLYFLFDGLTSLYIISALFGLFQGGIVPSYALIVREYFPASETSTRVALAITATLFGMALGGWMSGVIFDMTGSYRAAFLNGMAWNALNFMIAAWLMLRSRSGRGLRARHA
jgi:MFS family permease